MQLPLRCWREKGSDVLHVALPEENVAEATRVVIRLQ